MIFPASAASYADDRLYAIHSINNTNDERTQIERLHEPDEPTRTNGSGAAVTMSQTLPFLMIDSTKPNSAENPYFITSAADLVQLSQLVASGNDFSGTYFRQFADISLDGVPFLPIGSMSTAFKGSYDGMSFSVKGLSLSAADSAGLFGYIGQGAAVKNLKVSGTIKIEGGMAGTGGGIAGIANGAVISGCSFEGSVTVISGATSYAGGIVGNAENTKITSCTNSGIIASMSGAMLNSSGGIAGRMKGSSIVSCTNREAIGAADGTQSMAGGIVGSISSASVEGCVNTGEISADTGMRIAECLVYGAGIAGFGDGTSIKIANCKNSGPIMLTSSSASSYQYAGGITGNVPMASITSCENNGSVSAQNGGMIYVGGIAGLIKTNISSCRTYGAEIAAGGGSFVTVGGIAGSSSANITGCSAAGAVKLSSMRSGSGYATPGNVGGIVGMQESGIVSGCTSAAEVSGSGSGNSAVVYGGGIAGMSGGSMRNCAVSGKVTLYGQADIAGGIIGMMSHGASLSNSYGISSVKGAYAGLLAGYAVGMLSNCYSAGSASGMTQGPAGISDVNAKIEYCYWYSGTTSLPQSSASLLSGGNCAVFVQSSGELYTLTDTGVTVYGTKALTLLDALNTWVASGSNSVNASYWTNPAGNTNGGYPVFGEAPGNSISVTSGSGGKVTSDKSFAQKGSTVTLTVTPDSGYVLSTLTINGSYVKVSDTVKTYSFTMPDGSVTVNAVFSKKQTVPTGEYSITVGRISNGRVTVDTESAKKGDTVKVYVVPYTGYRLSSGSLKYNGIEIRMSAGGYSFTMPAEDVTITAAFIAGKGFTVKPASNLTNGKIIPDRDSAVAGEKVTFNVVPDEGYAVKQGSVTVNGEALEYSENGVYTFEMPSVNTTLRATFIKSSDYEYAIEVEETEHGTIEVDKDKAKPGEQVVVRITDTDENYRLKDGTLKYNDSKITEFSGEYMFTMPEEDVKITAEFEEYIRYKITLASGIKNGKITLSHTEAGEGDRISITVTPVSGYRLVGNSLKYNSIVVNKTGSGYSFVMPASNVTVTAQFEIIPGIITTTKPQVTETTVQAYVISLGTVKNGTVLVNQTSAKPGSTVSVTPKPNSGYQLKNGTLCFNGVQIPRSASGYSFVMPAAEVKITAEFKKISSISTYSVKVKSGISNGTLSVSPSNAASGTTVTVTVTPDSGYQLKSGTLKVNGVPIIPTGNSYRFVMPSENVTLEAEFEEKRHVSYIISISEMSGGSVTSDRTTAEAGDKVMLTITPDSGYKLSDGTLRCNDTVIISSGSSCYFLMPEDDVTVYAEFEPVGINGEVTTAPTDGYNVAVVSHSGGRIVKVGASEEGDISFSITPDEGFAVSDVIVDDVSIGAVNSYTFEKISGEHTIEAFFAEIEGEADAMDKLKDMMLTAGIIIVSAILILTALILLIVSIVKAVSGGRGERRRRAAKKHGEEDEYTVDTETEDEFMEFEFDENGEVAEDTDGDTAQFNAVNGDDNNANGNKKLR